MENRVMFNDPNLGELRLNRVFFEDNSPIFYTVTNNLSELFVCVYCYADSEMSKWLISPVSAETLIDMLSDKITLRECFLKSTKDKITVIQTYKNNEIDYKTKPYKEWYEDNCDDLPLEGEYMDVEDGEFDEEIEYFRNYDLIFLLENQTVLYNINKVLSVSFTGCDEYNDLFERYNLPFAA